MDVNQFFPMKLSEFYISLSVNSYDRKYAENDRPYIWGPIFCADYCIAKLACFLYLGAYILVLRIIFPRLNSQMHFQEHNF